MERMYCGMTRQLLNHNGDSSSTHLHLKVRRSETQPKVPRRVASLAVRSDVHLSLHWKVELEIPSSCSTFESQMSLAVLHLARPHRQPAVHRRQLGHLCRRFPFLFIKLHFDSTNFLQTEEGSLFSSSASECSPRKDEDDLVDGDCATRDGGRSRRR